MCLYVVCILLCNCRTSFLRFFFFCPINDTVSRKDRIGFFGQMINDSHQIFCFFLHQAYPFSAVSPSMLSSLCHHLLMLWLLSLLVHSSRPPKPSWPHLSQLHVQCSQSREAYVSCSCRKLEKTLCGMGAWKYHKQPKLKDEIEKIKICVAKNIILQCGSPS